MRVRFDKRAPIERRYESAGTGDAYLSRQEKRERSINRSLVNTSVYSSGSERGSSRAHVHFPKVRPESKPVTCKRWGDK